MLFIGDDWAEDHHDIEIEGDTGRRLTKARLPEGLAGITRFHALVADHIPAEWVDLTAEEIANRVVVGIESDRGPWVTALRAAGYQVFVINPLSAARHRERHSTSGAKSCGWIASTTGRSPETPTWWMRCNCWRGPIRPPSGSGPVRSYG